MSFLLSRLSLSVFEHYYCQCSVLSLKVSKRPLLLNYSPSSHSHLVSAMRLFVHFVDTLPSHHLKQAARSHQRGCQRLPVASGGCFCVCHTQPHTQTQSHKHNLSPLAPLPTHRKSFYLFFLVLWGRWQLPDAESLFLFPTVCHVQTSWVTTVSTWLNALRKKCSCYCWMGPSGVSPATAELRSLLSLSTPKHNCSSSFFPSFFSLSLSAVLHLLCVKQFSGMPKASTFSSRS